MPAAPPLLLVQLSDPHLFADPQGRLFGLDTTESLQQIVDLARREQPKIDLLLATGDLAQDGSTAAYLRFAQMTKALGTPARWTAGNHDCLANLREACSGTDFLEPVTDIGNWRVVLLNSQLPEQTRGHLAPQELQRLEAALSEAPQRHTLIALHHHPLDVGCQWLTPIGLDNADELFALLEGFPQVRVLLCGHVHQPFAQRRKGIKMLACPSCCIQFAAHSKDFTVSREAPGYRWLKLYQDGTVESGISRIDAAICQTIDCAGGGY